MNLGTSKLVIHLLPKKLKQEQDNKDDTRLIKKVLVYLGGVLANSTTRSWTYRSAKITTGSDALQGLFRTIDK